MKKILLVEDDKDSAALLIAQLKAANYHVLLACDSIQALSLMQKETPDLLLLDIQIPAGSGLTIAEKTLDFPQFIGIPFIFITANKDPAVQQRANQIGAKAFIEKPYDVQKLLQTIKETLHE